MSPDVLVKGGVDGTFKLYVQVKACSMKANFVIDDEQSLMRPSSLVFRISVKNEIRDARCEI